jgi:hydrogenase maturation protease
MRARFPSGPFFHDLEMNKRKKIKTLVLGLGNELYGDDGVGIHVVRRLKQKIGTNSTSSKDKNSIDFLECSLTGLALLDVIAGYDSLIIIDTIKSSDPKPGKIRLLDGTQLRHIPGPSPHYVSIPQTIEIGRKIGLKVPSQIKVIAVEAKTMYNLGEGLTQEMKKAIPRIIQEVQTLLKKLKET